MPTLDTDLSTWLTPKQTATRMGYANASSVCELIRTGQLTAIDRRVNPGPNGRPSYLVDPASIAAFVRRRMAKPIVLPPQAVMDELAAGIKPWQ